MAYKKITAGGISAFVNVGENIQIVIPNKGVVKLTKDSVVELLNYLRSYDFLIAKQNMENTYNNNFSAKTGYHVEDSNGGLVLVRIVPNKSGKFGDISFDTLDTDTAQTKSQLNIANPIMTKLVTLLKEEGVEATAPEYMGISFVDALPAETAAKRFTVYFKDGEYFTLNGAEDALDKIEVEEARHLPVAKVSAEEGVLYNLTRVQEEPDFKLTLKAGIYTYNATKNAFVLEDLTGVKKVQALPEKGNANILYVLTTDQKVSDEETRAKNSMWVFKSGKYTEETRKLIQTNHLDVAKIAEDGVNYLVDGVVTKFASGKFEKIGTVVAVDELPDTDTISVDATLIYELTKDDGERKKGTKWIFKTNAFEEYKA